MSSLEKKIHIVDMDNLLVVFKAQLGVSHSLPLKNTTSSLHLNFRVFFPVRCMHWKYYQFRSWGCFDITCNTLAPSDPCWQLFFKTLATSFRSPLHLSCAYVPSSNNNLLAEHASLYTYCTVVWLRSTVYFRTFKFNPQKSIAIWTPQL